MTAPLTLRAGMCGLDRLGESKDSRKAEWKPGLPPGKYYEGMTDDFEVYFSPGGMKWHRRRARNPALTTPRADGDAM